MSWEELLEQKKQTLKNKTKHHQQKNPQNKQKTLWKTKKEAYHAIISPAYSSNFPMLIAQDFPRGLCPCI